MASLKMFRIVFNAAIDATLFVAALYAVIVLYAVLTTVEEEKPQPLPACRYEARWPSGELLRTEEGWVMEFDSEAAASKYAREYEAADHRRDALAGSPHRASSRR